jgi:phosphoribosyl-ATP pyrophosphohydrolase/phosphoribosyl-AMP cyclohydrolase
MNQEWVETLDWEKVDGLLPAVVQDADDGAVLMLGYMNRSALLQTLAEGEVTFYSRTRQALWRKGETSGNVLKLTSIDADCDRDTLLVRARPAGPVCHLGTRSCFKNTSAAQAASPGDFLQTLEQIIRQRAGDSPETSYTARLLRSGVQRIAQKVGEEGVETALAAVAAADAELVGESADLVFHLLVMLASRGLGLQQVVEELRQRHQTKTGKA